LLKKIPSAVEGLFIYLNDLLNFALRHSNHQISLVQSFVYLKEQELLAFRDRANNLIRFKTTRFGFAVAT